MKDRDIGFHLDDINHDSFKIICLLAEKNNIELDNFNFGKNKQDKLRYESNRYGYIEDLINEIIKEA